MLAHTTRALELLFQAVAEVDTLEELARAGTVAVELYEGDAAVLRELMRAIEAQATAILSSYGSSPAREDQRDDYVARLHETSDWRQVSAAAGSHPNASGSASRS